MSISEKITEALKEAFDIEEVPLSEPIEESGPKPRYGKRWRSEMKGTGDFAISGTPVYNLNWDDVGLGLMKSMGFAPTKAVQLSFTKGKWKITGAYASSAMLIWILLGGGGIIYFLRDLLNQVKDWGWIGSTFLAFLPIVLNLFIRQRTLEFQPFEIEMLGYDPQSRILVISTITQPGGVLALKVSLPFETRKKNIEEQRLIETLQHAHAGFMRIDGLATYNFSRLRDRSLWTLVWVIVFYLYYRYFM